MFYTQTTGTDSDKQLLVQMGLVIFSFTLVFARQLSLIEVYAAANGARHLSIHNHNMMASTWQSWQFVWSQPLSPTRRITLRSPYIEVNNASDTALFERVIRCSRLSQSCTTRTMDTRVHFNDANSTRFWRSVLDSTAIQIANISTQHLKD
jgi:hypothetical protein